MNIDAAVFELRQELDEIAAVEACAAESSKSLPLSHYEAITKVCVERISASAEAKYQAMANAKTMSSTASN